MLPLVADIKRSSLDDGPGIRTVVFWKGCPLRCEWCQNPETISRAAEVQREPERCLGCGGCATACAAGVATPAREEESGDGCVLCGLCAEACPASARRLVGRAYEAQELLAALVKDEPFYRSSGGGVTFSGGEPCLAPRFVGEVAKALHERRVHVLVETSGSFDWATFSEHLLPWVDTVFFDLKIAHEEAHRARTGVGNGRIWDNLERLVGDGSAHVLVRTPLVPGITDGEENLRALATRARRLGLSTLKLLPYNPLWIPKRRALGQQLPYDCDRWMSADEVARCQAVVDEVFAASP